MAPPPFPATTAAAVVSVGAVHYTTIAPYPPPATTDAAAAVVSVTPTALHPTVTEENDPRRTIAEIVKRESLPGLHGRRSVKEAIVMALQLHRSAATLKKVIQSEERISSDVLLYEELCAKANSLQQQSDDILNVDPNTINCANWEVRFLEYVQQLKIKDTTDERELTTNLKRWVDNQRARKRSLDAGQLSGKRNVAAVEDVNILSKIGFLWKNPYLAACHTTWDKSYELLLEFREQHGHCRVPQLHPQLGQWVKGLRRQYEAYRNGGKKASALNAERIDAMNKIGFIWKIRPGRRKKDDASFRNRRKSDEATSPQAPQHEDEQQSDFEQDSAPILRQEDQQQAD